MKKPILSIVLMFSIVLSFSACISFHNEDDTPTSSEVAETGTPTTDTESSADSFEYVRFGTYEQDGDLENGAEPIIWIVLEEKDGKLLLISTYILDYQDFNDTTIARGISWENCSLREWLNNDFYNSAFSETEKQMILTTEVQDYNSDNVPCGTTADKVFLLNKDQAFSYFSNDEDRATRSTAYARSQKSYVTNSYWLINSYDSTDLYKYLINSEGRNENNPRVNESEGIRPVIWVSVES